MDTLYPNNSKQYSGSSKSTTTVSKAHETKTPSRSVVSSQSVIAEEKAPAAYNELMERLAEVPTKTKQSRQKLYVDLWSGQHWLGLTLSAPDNHHVMMPVSEDTAVSVSVSPDYISLTLKDT